MRDGRFVTRAPTRDAHAPADGQPDGGPRARRPVSRRRTPRPHGAAPLLKVRGLTRARLGATTSSFEVRAGRDPRLRRPGRRGPHRAVRGPARPAAAQRCGASRSTAARCACAARAKPREHGLTYLSEDRKGKGLHVDFGLRENLTLMALRPLRAALARARRASARAEARRSPSSASAPARSSMPRVVAVRRQPAEAGAREGAAARPARDRARRADARRRRRRQARHLFPDPAPRRARAAP